MAVVDNNLINIITFIMMMASYSLNPNPFSPGHIARLHIQTHCSTCTHVPEFWLVAYGQKWVLPWLSERSCTKSPTPSLHRRLMNQVDLGNYVLRIVDPSPESWMWGRASPPYSRQLNLTWRRNFYCTKSLTSVFIWHSNQSYFHITYHFSYSRSGVCAVSKGERASQRIGLRITVCKMSGGTSEDILSSNKSLVCDLT